MLRPEECSRAHNVWDTLVVTNIDSLGRFICEAVTIIADLAERDINVCVLNSALDTSKPTDKVAVGIMTALAEWERDLLIKRTKMGVVNACTEGGVGDFLKALTDDEAC